jgi:hypothetical protein
MTTRSRRGTLFMVETHQVVGRHAAEFEDLHRGEWMGALSGTDDVRLLWYLNHAMGSGPAYQVVTITALADGRAWESLADRMLTGDLTGLADRIDRCRYGVAGTLVTPVTWSPMQDVDLATVPTDGREHELTLYMQDTGWPDAPLDDYIEMWDQEYWRHMRRIPRERALLDIVGCFQVAHGSGVRPEAMLMQKIVDYGSLGNLFARQEAHDPATWPGSYMAKGLEVRDQWESRLLRTSSWSPLW